MKIYFLQDIMEYNVMRYESREILSSSGPLIRSRSSDDNLLNEKNVDNNSGITDKITCYRPNYEEGLIIKGRKEDNLFIIDNLGHSGSGWTIGPGTVDMAINILMEKLDNSSRDNEFRDSIKKNGISIVGAGCIGLFTAIMLDNKFRYNNNNTYNDIKIKIIAEELDNTTSHNAGGLISVTCLENDKDKSRLEKSALFSYDFYRDISKYIPGLDENIIRELPAYFSGKDEDCEKGYDDGLQLFLENGKISKTGPYVITFPNGIKIDNIYKYNPLFIQTDELMKKMRDRLKELNIEIIKC
ncbi:MAG: hypothetical protein EOP34_11060, partial [Rickettsiales bacterium]